MKLINLVTLVVIAVAAPNDLDGITSLEPRSDQWKYCGIFATGDREGAKRIAHDVGSCTSKEDGGYGSQWEVEGIQFTNPLSNASCLGIACDEDTFTEVWVCNDNSYVIYKSCSEIAHWVNRIIDECCTDPSSKGISGQYFLGDGTNINVGWGGCKTYSNPSDGGPGDGQCRG